MVRVVVEVDVMVVVPVVRPSAPTVGSLALTALNKSNGARSVERCIFARGVIE